MGIAYTLFGATIWPCVPFLVGRHQIATAYGLVTASLNLALFVFPFVVAWVRNLHSDDFTFVQYFNIALSIIGVILSLFMRQYDKKHGNMLAKVHTHEKVLIYHDDEAASEVNGDADLESPSSKTTHLHQSSYLTRERSHDSSFIIQVVGEGISIQAPHTYKTHLLSAEHVT